MADRRSETPRRRRTRKRSFVATFETGHGVPGGRGPGFLVPFDPEHDWGTKPRPIPSEAHGKDVPGHPVRATVNGHAFDGWIGRRWGRSFLLLDEEVQRAAGVRPGEVAELTVAPRRTPAAAKPKRASSRMPR